MEQRNQRFHSDNFRGMLGRLLRLDILALVRHGASTSSNFPFHYCTYQADRPSYNVREAITKELLYSADSEKPDSTHWLSLFCRRYKSASAFSGSQWRLSYHGWCTSTAPVVHYGFW